ncbi:MAG: metallopeptidase family protein [Actinomycetia bacterium]|nr:metallopeptidase family protein [Actinomycetes bacterium]
MGSNQPKTPARTGSRRDRRGRGLRGPLSLPGPLTPDGVPGIPTAAADFDAVVLGVIDRIRARVGDRIDSIEFAVEDHPLLPDDWQRAVPYASSVPEHTGTRARVVVFRRPILTHSAGEADLAALVLDTLIDELAELWAMVPDDIDPRTAD